MPTNPNKAFSDRELKGGPNVMMNDGQRAIILRLCRQHDISLFALTSKAFGYQKHTKDLTHTEAAQCIQIAGVWNNLRKSGYEK